MATQQQTTTQQDAEKSLLEAINQIAAIADTNCHYVAGLARRIADSGKTVGSLSVAELLALDAKHNAFYNSLPL